MLEAVHSCTAQPFCRDVPTCFPARKGALCTTEQTRRAQSDIMALMITDLTISAEAKAESDKRWTQWIAAGARRSREGQKRAATFAIVIAVVLSLWLAKVLVLG